MEIKRSDRRINRTRRMLREALFALILERGYDAVTIEDITGRADLGRTTFYLHYRDKEELLLESIDSLVDDLVANIAELAAPAMTTSAEDNPVEQGIETRIGRVFEHAAENADLYRIILRGEGGEKVTRRLREIINMAVSQFFNLLAERNLGAPEIPMDIFSNYFASALLGTITWWLENELPYPPAHMAAMFMKMFMPGARQVMRA